MNLNLHIVHLPASEADVHFEAIESAAYEALISDNEDEATLMALAELVDLEEATLGALSGMGKRCRRALEQRAIGAADRGTLERLASRSGCLSALYARFSRAALLAA